ncbi:fimbria/pilus periplasmic chaperone [Burkholderia sp. AU39826]|uniref:fimbrial biogenesis chaperone n=1 Tax=Burkholderia sp. AU39826 TaxID=2879634 RepID=UPI001CF24458|nr:fimbria/pilus periplasmic chaperone [Burkholderia sp. AU39826]MCA7969381.1 fimbria/pilus periplasmic chaperone [Burkholderia sp. AU39826]
MHRSTSRFDAVIHTLRPRWRHRPVVVRVVCAAVLGCVASIGTMRCDAALSVVGTRFVYPGDARALTIFTRNDGDAPILVQAWLDDGDPNADPGRLRVPFVVSPPLARLDPGQPLTIRVQSLGGGLAADRESCFWINLLEVPPAAPAGEHALRIAYRLRMKLLVRPPSLDGDPDEAPNRLAWSHAGANAAASPAPLVALNPTPYYVTLTRVLLNGKGAMPANTVMDIAPFGRVEIPVGTQAGAGPGEIVFDAVDDSGAAHEYRARLAPP